MATKLNLTISLPITCLCLAGCATQAQPKLDAMASLEQEAHAAYASNNLSQAQTDYLALTKALPDDVDNWFRLGNIYARSGQLEKAVNAYRHVLKHDAEHAKAWHNLGVVLIQQSQAAFLESARNAQEDRSLMNASLAMEKQIGALLSGPAPSSTAAENAPSEKGN